MSYSKSWMYEAADEIKGTFKLLGWVKTEVTAEIINRHYQQALDKENDFRKAQEEYYRKGMGYGEEPFG